MPVSNLNQLNLGNPTGSKVLKATGNPVSIENINPVPRSIKADKDKVQPTDTEALYDVWAKDPSNENLNTLITNLQPQINKSISALVPKPTSAVNSRARLLAIKAVKTYEPSGDAKLTSWVFTQLQPLKRYAQQSGPVPVSERMARQQAELFKFEEEFNDNHNRYPSDRELSDLMKISKEQLARIRKFSKARVHELQQFGANPEESATASEITGTMPDKTEEIVDLFYDSLSPLEQTIIEHRLGLRGRKPIPNSAVALKVKLSPARVSQISSTLADRLDEFKSIAEEVL